MSTTAGDAHELPFPDATFARLTSRLAAMYFADYPRAFREALRVLEPGGTAVYLVWGAFEQPMFKDIIGALFKYVPPPDEKVGAPSPFTFSDPGRLSRALEAAGFVGVREESATLPTTFPGSPALWWQWLVDTAAPVQAWVDSLANEDREKALEEIHHTLRRYYDGERVNVPIDVIVGSGRRPR